MNPGRKITQLVAILAVAFGLKYFYSLSSVNDLRWILAPTTFLVELITGTEFRFESNAGYLSDDRTFLIALPCSGVNFLIIAFLMLALGAIWREWPNAVRWRSLLISAAVAFVTTLIANTTRIAIAMWLQHVDLGYDYEDVHRIEGIIVYFGFLLLLFFAAEKFARGDLRLHRPPRSVMRRIAIPVMVYYGFTLGIPLAGGAFRDAEFWKHALIVFVTSTVVMLPLVVICLARCTDSKGKSQPYFER